MSAPLVAPVRDGAFVGRAIHNPENRRERSDGLRVSGDSRASLASHPAIDIFMPRLASAPRRRGAEFTAVTSQKGAAIKCSLTLSWLILPSCPQAP
jgi:hypothetical protein